MIIEIKIILFEYYLLKLINALVENVNVYFSIHKINILSDSILADGFSIFFLLFFILCFAIQILRTVFDRSSISFFFVRIVLNDISLTNIMLTDLDDHDKFERIKF